VNKISDLIQLLKDPNEGLARKTRKYKKQEYKKAFIGSEAVDWMVSKMRIKTRKAAVQLGETLLHRGIIEHVSHSEPFLDSKTSYYRFRSKKERQTSVWYPDEKITYLIDMMRLNLELKTRSWRLVKYKDCFTGCDLVDWLSTHLKLSREDAVAFGQEMMRRSIFHHVTFSEPFVDEPHLYRFYQDEKKYRTTKQMPSERLRSFGSSLGPLPHKTSSGRNMRERYHTES